MKRLHWGLWVLLLAGCRLTLPDAPLFLAGASPSPFVAAAGSSPSPAPAASPTATPTPMPGLDPRLVGTWGVYLAVFDVELGAIAIGADGSYDWRYPDGSPRAHGTLCAYTPARPPRYAASTEYWAIDEGGELVYLTMDTDRHATLYADRTDLYWADATLRP